MDMTVERVTEYSLDSNVHAVLNMLDEAINEYERGEFVSEEDLFRELESIK